MASCCTLSRGTDMGPICGGGEMTDLGHCADGESTTTIRAMALKNLCLVCAVGGAAWASILLTVMAVI